MRPLAVYRIRKITAALFGLLFAFEAFGQNADTTQVLPVASDSLSVNVTEVIGKKESGHNIRRATILSAVIPGAGQIYNRKWWKAPIVYAGLGTTIYLAIFNQNEFMRYSDAFDFRQEGGVDEFSGRLSESQLISNMRFYQGNRDLSIVFAVLVYGLNIIDANVDAHLFDFDVSDDLSFRMEPTYRSGAFGSQTGFALTFNF